MRHYIFYIDQDFIKDRPPDYYARKLSAVLEAPVKLEVVSPSRPLSADRVQESMHEVGRDERACLVLYIHGSAIDDKHNLFSPGTGYTDAGRSPYGDRLVRRSGDYIPSASLVGEVATAYNKPLDIGMSSCNMTRNDIDQLLEILPEGATLWSEGATDTPLTIYPDGMDDFITTLEDMKKGAARQARKLDELPIQAVFYALTRNSLTQATSTNFPLFAVAGGEQYDFRKKCAEFMTLPDSEHLLRSTGLPDRITRDFQHVLASNIGNYLDNVLLQTRIGFDSRTMGTMRKAAAERPASFPIKAADINVDHYRSLFGNQDFMEVDSRFIERLSQDIARRAIEAPYSLTLQDVCIQAIEGLCEYPELPESSQRRLRDLPESIRCSGFSSWARVPDYLHHDEGKAAEGPALQSAQIYCSGETRNLFSHVFQCVKQYLEGSEAIADGSEKYWLDMAREFVEQDPGFMEVGNARHSTGTKAIGTFLPDIMERGRQR